MKERGMLLHWLNRKRNSRKNTKNAAFVEKGENDGSAKSKTFGKKEQDLAG